MNRAILKNKIKKICPNTRKYEFYKGSIIYKDEDGVKHVIKENDGNILETYNYLNSRGFGYIPRLEYLDDDVYVYEYVEDIKTPDEQRMSDLVKLDALLHNKTVYYKDTSIDEIKEMYEKLSSKIDDTYNYYDDIITTIESRIYMSPSEYMLARNCSSIFSCLGFSKTKINEWYKLMENKPKKRLVLLHNNLESSHLVESKENMLISWNKTSRDLPIYDFIKLYKNNFDSYDFNELYKEYIKLFPLTEEERMLMFIILFIPPKITFSKSEIVATTEVSKLCNYLFTTDRLFMENETKNSEKQDNKINE